jgi:hypothetical protein
MKQTLKREIPVGTPEAEARRFMERQGFSCTLEKQQSFSEQGKTFNDLDFLYCTRSDTSTTLSLVSREWKIAVVVQNHLVSDILVSSGLLGP